MGGKAIATDIPAPKVNPKHEKNMTRLWDIAEEHFGKVRYIEPASRNQTYKIHFCDGRLLKAVFTGILGDYHQLLFDDGVRVPRILKKIEIDTQFAWKFVEWIEGQCWSEAISITAVYKEIPAKCYYKLGKMAAQIANCTDGSKPLEIADILWGNFIYDDQERLWLIDTKTVNPSNTPEWWILHRVIFHPCSFPWQKEAFIKGYIEVIDKRAEILLEHIKYGNQFMGKLHAKLARI